MPNEPTTSLLHHNDCTANSGAPCTCEPPLTTVEEVAGALFACHEIEYLDAETGYACGCDEDGFLELPTLEAARKHQAADMVAVLTPLLTADLRARVGVLEGQLATAREELDALEPIAAPHRRTAKEREGYRRHAAWQSAEHYLKQAEAAARKWTREAEWLREFRDTRKAETEAGAWPPPGDFDCCANHPAKALGLDGGDPDGE